MWYVIWWSESKSKFVSYPVRTLPSMDHNTRLSCNLHFLCILSRIYSNLCYICNQAKHNDVRLQISVQQDHTLNNFGPLNFVLILFSLQGTHNSLEGSHSLLPEQRKWSFEHGGLHILSAVSHFSLAPRQSSSELHPNN